MKFFVFIFFGLFVFLFSNFLSLGQSDKSSRNLAEERDPESFLTEYHAQVKTLLKKKEYDSLLLLLKELENAVLSQNTEIKAHILLDKGMALYHSGRAGEAPQFYYEAAHLAEKLESKRLLGEVLFQHGVFFAQTSRPDSALDRFDRSLSIFRELNDTSQLINSIGQRGMVFDNLGLYSRALETYLEGLALERALGDSSGIAQTLNNIAIIYKKQEDLQSAEKYYLESWKLADAMGNEYSKAVTDVNLGLLYKDLGRLDRADSLLERTLHYFQAEKNMFAVAIVYHNLGSVKFAKKEYSESEDLLKKSLKLGLEIQMGQVSALNYLFLAKIDYELGRYQHAIQNLKQGLEFGESHNLLHETSQIYEWLAKAYRRAGDYRMALESYENHIAIKDSLFNDNTTQTINRLRTEYEVNQKDLQIASLEKESELKDGLVQAEKTNSTLLTIFIGVLIIFVIFLWLAYHNRTRLTKRLIEQKTQLAEQKEEIESAQESLIEKNVALEKINKEKDEIIGIVAHDLRSPLNQVKGLLNIIKPQITDEGSAEMVNLALKSTEILRERVNRILDVEAINAGKIDVKLENLYPENILEELLSHFSETASGKQIQLIKENDSVEQKFEADKNYLLQVMENLLSNAIKYSPHGKSVWVGAKTDVSKLIFFVKDEGPGLDEYEQTMLFQKFTKLSTRPTANEDSSGLGLSIVKKYVDAMGGKVWCESEKGKGSSFFVAFAARNEKSCQNE